MPEPLPPPPPPPPPVPAPALSYGYLTPEEMAARKRRTHLWVIVGSMVAVVLLAWFGKVMWHASSEASSAVTDLHSRMQQHDWDGIYSEAASGWKNTETSDETRTLFTGIDRKLGQPLSTKQFNIHVDANGGGRFITASFTTRFERDPEAEESITWKYEDGKFRLLRYHISSGKFLEP
jgi:hypothetical protein